MDEFGVLVQSIGFRANGKSAPMANLKPKPKPPLTTRNSAFDDSLSLPVDELDGIFRSSAVNFGKVNPSPNFFSGDDIFGGPVSNSHQYGGVDLESVFSSLNNQRNGSGSLSSRNSVGSGSYDDLLGSKPKQKDDVDLLGDFGRNFKQEKKGAGFDDLVPGFGGVKPSKTKRSSSTGTDDPFLLFESPVPAPTAGTSWPFESALGNDTGKASVQSSMDDFEEFVTGGSSRGSKVQGSQTESNEPSPRSSSNVFDNTNYVDEIFGGGNQAHQNSATRRQPSHVAKSSTFDDFFFKETKNKVKRAPSEPSFGIKKSSSATNIGTDFTSLFGDVTTPSGEFLEIDGEPAERREIRLKNHIMKNERVAAALAAKNQRDLQQRREQEEKHRLGEALDFEIKRWAAGKEGNLRALLSSLHLILGPESGWRPVGLTDMITSDSVRKVYRKTNLYVHPDKVQQRGASLQQQYIAEKVFDLLKEASTKFSVEELR